MLATDAPTESEPETEASLRSSTPAISAAIALALAAGAIFLAQNTVRRFEARIAEPFVAVMLGYRTSVYAVRNDIVFPAGGHRLMALSIETTCSSAVMVLPMMVAIAALLVVGRTMLGRALAGLAFGVGVVVSVNAVRIGGIAFAVAHWGMDPGYEVSHKVVGSAFAIFGFATGLIVTIDVATGERTAHVPSPQRRAGRKSPERTRRRTRE